LLAEQTPRRLAVLGFYADWGHVQPLIRAAAVARAAGWTVCCFLPSRAKAVVEQENLKAIYFDDLQDPQAMVRFRRLSSWPLFFRQFAADVHVNLGLIPQVYRSMLDSLPELASELAAFAPDIIMADSHVFGPFYRHIGASLGRPVVLHEPSGALAGAQRLYVQRLGEDRLPSPVKRLAEFAGLAFEFAFRRAYYLSHAVTWARHRATKAQAWTEFAKHFPSRPSSAEAPTITTTMAWVEKSLLGGDLCGNLRACFPPLPARDTGLDADLESWIAADPEPIIYISFGSMVSLSRRVHAGLVRQLAATGRRIIWSAPQEELAELAPLVGSDPRFLLRSYLAQPQLLKRKEVVCFLTHGGANSALEALIGGTPMVCAPFFADQPYMAGLLERMGVARRIPKAKLGSDQVRRAIEAMLQPSAQDRSAAISARLAGEDGPAELLRYLVGQIEAVKA
jgi:UDP:flavonoid glycosyltransferase YjiC (YdhE family)